MGNKRFPPQDALGHDVDDSNRKPTKPVCNHGKHARLCQTPIICHPTNYKIGHNPIRHLTYSKEGTLKCIAKVFKFFQDPVQNEGWADLKGKEERLDIFPGVVIMGLLVPWIVLCEECG